MIDDNLGPKSVVTYKQHIETHVVKPPPPIPANARAPINCVMFCAKEHSKLPAAKITYANNRQLLRPNMSLSLPYNGLRHRQL